MRKYGIEHFHVSLLEETNNPEERECYWIEQLRSFKNGYNATLGGDGVQLYDYEFIVELYDSGLNGREICQQLNCDSRTVMNALSVDCDCDKNQKDPVMDEL